MKKMFFVLMLAAVFAMVFTSCESDATVASYNVSKAADNFEVFRRVVFYNGITDKYILMVEGYCSIEDDGHQLELTVKVGPGSYLKHFLALSDNVTYFCEQLDPAMVSDSHYRVVFKPSVIVPDIDVR